MYDIELIDTRYPYSKREIGITLPKTIASGKVSGRYPKQALRKFSKTLPKSVNLSEMRDSKYARYVFMWSEQK